MKVLVTGSNGFIGSHLVDYLVVQGYDVFCLVRKQSNLKWIRDLNVEFVYGDCRDKGSLFNAVKEKDFVLHLAGKIKADDWNTYYSTNYIGTKNLIEACVEVNPKIKKFVLISSISAAGPSVKNMLKKEDDPCTPITDYGKSKLMGEEAVVKFSHKIPYVIIRPPNIYGPREEEFYSVLKLIKKRIKPLLGNGENQVSVCFVHDLVRAILMAAVHPDAIGSTYYMLQ